MASTGCFEARRKPGRKIVSARMNAVAGRRSPVSGA